MDYGTARQAIYDAGGCAASNRRTSVCILESGTTSLLDLLGKTACVQITLHAEIPGNRQRLAGRGVFEFAHIPKRAQPEFRKRAVIKRLEIHLKRVLCHMRRALLQYAG
jgi:hypothetical protein